MTIDFYNNSSPKNAINKNISAIQGGTLAGTLKEGSSIADPVILIESATLPAGNYVHIADFSRYYYIRDIVNTNTNLWELHLHSDPLYSFRDAILDAPCMITKTASNDFNLYMPDPNFKCQQNTKVGMVPFPSGFSIDNARYYVTFFG